MKKHKVNTRQKIDKGTSEKRRDGPETQVSQCLFTEDHIIPLLNKCDLQVLEIYVTFCVKLHLVMFLKKMKDWYATLVDPIS